MSVLPEGATPTRIRWESAGSSSSGRAMPSWIIGSGADCDLVVAQPTVSGRHCRLTRGGEGYVLEDLGSSNGTYVNGARITSPTRVRAADHITLGLSTPMPWPS